VPVVVGPHQGERQIRVVGGEHPRRERREGGEVHGGQDTAGAHVLHPFVHVPAAGPNLVEALRLHAVLRLGPAGDCIERRGLHRELAEHPHVVALVVAHQLRRAVEVLGRQVVGEQVGRLDDVIVDTDPTTTGRVTCPGVKGASNWFSPSYNPETGLFYVMTIEQCDMYMTSARPYNKSECYDGTGAEPVPAEPGQFLLRAIDIQNGEIRWEIPMVVKDTMEPWPGTVSTAGGLVFFGDNEGYLSAADSRTGKVLWHFNTGQSISASPMTYSVKGKQFVTLATGGDIFTFGLFRPMLPAAVNVKERYEGK